MPPERDDLAYLSDMLVAARAVSDFVHGETFESYLDNLMMRSAVERQVEIISEAARNVSRAFRDAHDEIEWVGIIARRHVLAHEYGVIKDDLVRHVATMHVPDLIEIPEAMGIETPEPE